VSATPPPEFSLGDFHEMVQHTEALLADKEVQGSERITAVRANAFARANVFRLEEGERGESERQALYEALVSELRDQGAYSARADDHLRAILVAVADLDTEEKKLWAAQIWLGRAKGPARVKAARALANARARVYMTTPPRPYTRLQFEDEQATLNEMAERLSGDSERDRRLIEDVELLKAQSFEERSRKHARRMRPPTHPDRLRVYDELITDLKAENAASAKVADRLAGILKVDPRGKRHSWKSLPEILADGRQARDGRELTKTDPPPAPQAAIVSTPHSRPRERRDCSSNRERASPSSDDDGPSDPADADSSDDAPASDEFPLAAIAVLLAMAGIRFAIEPFGIDAACCPSCRHGRVAFDRAGVHGDCGCTARDIGDAFAATWRDAHEGCG